LSALLCHRPTTAPTGHQGLGSWTAVITTSITAAMQATNMIYQQRVASDAATRARHEAARQQQREADARAADLAHQKALMELRQEEAMAAGATGGAMVIGPDGKLIPASGIMSRIPGGGITLLAVAGAAVIGGFLLLKGRG